MQTSEATTTTPDGHRLRVRRAAQSWVVSWRGGEVRSTLLDVALIAAVRAAGEVVAHSNPVEYGRWARDEADRIERNLTLGGES